MFWPTSVEHVKILPEVKVESKQSKTELITYDSHDDGRPPHLDPIIDIVSCGFPVPYAVITYRSLYLFDAITHSPIAAHVRSDQSIESYGKNKRIVHSQQNGRKFFAVETDGKFLMLYALTKLPLNSSDYHNDDESNGFNSRDEILTIFSREGKVLQNGFPIQAPDANLVQSFLNVFFHKGQKELPNYDMGLRLKLLLKVQSPLNDYFFIGNNQILLGTLDPPAFQVVSLSNKTNRDIDPNDPGKHIEVTLIDGLEWYTDSESLTKSFHYNPFLGCFIWINELGNCWLVTMKAGSNTNTQFVGKKIYQSSNEGDKAEGVLINEQRNLIVIGTSQGELYVYKLNRDLSVTRLRVIKKHIHSNGLKKLVSSPNGDSFIAIHQNGWNLYSTLGNMTFSTFDFDSVSSNMNWYTDVIDIRFLSDFQMILIKKENIFVINLTQLNHSHVMNHTTLKRPVLFSNDRIHVFKGYDKSLIDHHTAMLGQSATNKETHLWITEMLPVSFKLNNSEIRCVAASDDGNFVCVVGNMNVMVYDCLQNTWKLLSHGHDESQDVRSNPVRVCLWWKNHLILGSRTHDITDLRNKDKCKSEVIAFSPHVIAESTEFTFDQVLWGFNFDETPFDENFLMLNIDLSTDELLVFSDELNCYTWKISLSSSTSTTSRDLTKNAHSSLGPKSTNVSKTSVIFKKSVVYQLKNCLISKPQTEIDLSTLINLKCAIKVNDSDLVVLVDSTLVYIKKRTQMSSTANTPVASSSSSMIGDQERPLPPNPQSPGPSRAKLVYHTYFLMDGVEYINKATPNLLIVFNGAQIVHYDMTNEPDLTRILPIEINIGNETTKASSQLNEDTQHPRSQPQASSSIHPVASMDNFDSADKVPEARNMSVSEKAIMIESNGTTAYPIVSIPDKNMIFGIEIDINQIDAYSPVTAGNGTANVGSTVSSTTTAVSGSTSTITNTSSSIQKNKTGGHSMQVIRLETVKTNYLSSLIDYYVRLNVQLEKNDAHDLEALSIASIYKKFHRFKHFSFCLELLLSNYIIYEAVPDKAYNESLKKKLLSDAQGDTYFDALVKLIAMTGLQYTVYLNLLKKIEIEYWNTFFQKLGETPRQSLEKIFNVLMDYKLSAHYFIIMLNYGKESRKEEENGVQISKEDQDLVSQILVKLVTLEKDYTTAFELLRFIKLIDNKICKKITEKLQKTVNGTLKLNNGN